MDNLNYKTTKVFDEYLPNLFKGYLPEMRTGVFDIETTGLSPRRSKVILIGTMLPSRQGSDIYPVTTQLFAENLEDEPFLLNRFAETLRDVDVLVSYNGDNFDIPFLKARAAEYGIKLPHVYSLDLYRLVKGYSDIRKFTPNLKQKTLEDFMGLWTNRDDEISGGESVDLYYDFLRDQSRDKKDKILLHNKDDVLQLYKLLAVGKKIDIHKGFFNLGFPCSINNHLVAIERMNIKGNTLEISGAQLRNPVNCVFFGDDLPSYDFSKERFVIQVPLIIHEGLILADMNRFLLSSPESTEGFMILGSQSSNLLNQKETTIDYYHVNILSKLLVERILTNEL